MSEFIEEGLAATNHTLNVYAQSWNALSHIANEVVSHGMYVPMFLPERDKPVLLVVLRDANTLTAKSLHQAAPEMLITIAEHTGECCRDDNEGYYTDSWRFAPNHISIIDCAKDAVYWLSLPDQWQEVNFVGMGIPIPAITSDIPVFKHLCFQTDHQSQPLTPKSNMPIYLRTDIEWQIKEPSHER